jgi:predicted amidohydrolase YtcJ
MVVRLLRKSSCTVAALLLTLVAAGPVDAEQERPLVLRGAAIYTLDRARPWANALVVRNGRIRYVGDDAGAMAFAGAGARAIVLDGRMVIPGLHDSHVHPMTGGMRLLRCRLGDAKTPEQIYAAVRACAAARPKDPWLLGGGWSPEAFSAGGPSRRTLDELVPDRPALLTTEDGYSAWANTRALAAAGIQLDGSGAQVGGIEREPETRAPSGILKDDAVVFVKRRAPPPTEAEFREALRRSTAMANRFGITSMVDASADEAVLDAYRAADRAGELTVRVVAAQRIDLRRGEEQIAEMRARRDRVRGTRFRADAAKLFLDGEIDRHTAALIEPYADAPAVRGDLFVEPAVLNRLVRRLDAEGFLIHMHAMGDRAVRAGLDAIEQAIRANGVRDRRHQLAHVGVAAPADIARFGRLGVTADFQPLWAQADDPATRPAEAALGPLRSRWMFPIASIAAMGGRILASSDWPAPSMNPLDAIQVALTRQPLDGSKPPQQPQERVPLAAMLAAYTNDAAWAAREETIDGSLEVGKAADLVVLDRNLFEVEVSRLHEVRVLLTLLDGEPVYRDPSIAWP